MRKQIVFRGKTYEVIKEYEDCYLTVDEHLNRKKFPKLTIVKWCEVQISRIEWLKRANVMSISIENIWKTMVTNYDLHGYNEGKIFQKI